MWKFQGSRIYGNFESEEGEHVLAIFIFLSFLFAFLSKLKDLKSGGGEHVCTNVLTFFSQLLALLARPKPFASASKSAALKTFSFLILF